MAVLVHNQRNRAQVVDGRRFSPASFTQHKYGLSYILIFCLTIFENKFEDLLSRFVGGLIMLVVRFHLFDNRSELLV